MSSKINSTFMICSLMALTIGTSVAEHNKVAVTDAVVIHPSTGKPVVVDYGLCVTSGCKIFHNAFKAK